MQITIFGANGKVGSLVVAGALKRGHKVVAFIHSKSRLPTHRNMSVVQGNIYNAADVIKAVSESEVVISVLGSWGTPKKDVLSAGMRNIIPAMQKAKITRIVSLTGGGANTPKDNLTLLDKMGHGLMKLAAAKILDDGEQHIRLLEQSGLNWTVLRSPVMTTWGSPLNYKLTDKRPAVWATINRNSVALAIIEQLDSDIHSQQAPYMIR